MERTRLAAAMLQQEFLRCHRQMEKVLWEQTVRPVAAATGHHLKLRKEGKVTFVG